MSQPEPEWQFDPVWNYFVRGDAIALHEQVTNPYNRQWAARIGLTSDVVEHLLAHPTEGAYQPGYKGRTTA